MYEEGIIGGKTAPQWNGTGVDNYVDALLESTKPKTSTQTVTPQAQKTRLNVPAAQSGMVSQAVVAGRDNPNMNLNRELKTRKIDMSAKPYNVDTTSPEAQARTAEMQKRVAERQAQQSQNNVVGEGAENVITKLLDAIYGR